MSDQIVDQEVDLIEDITEEQLEGLVEDVEVDEELVEASAKKEAKKTDEESDDEAEVEVDDEESEVEDEDEDEDDDEKSESYSKKKKMAKEDVDMPSTKAGMIKAIYEKMSEMSKDDLTTAYNKVIAEESEEAVEEVAESAELELNVDFSQDLDALVDGEEALAEGFKDKAAVIFEAAVKTKVTAEVQRLEESYAEKLAEESESARGEIVEKVDGYLNYVVEQWMETNEVAVTNGLRTEIAENFIDSLQSLFVENYIEVPESKVDMVDELAGKVEELEEQLNKTVGDNIDLAEKVSDFRREEIIREATVGMAETEVEKLRTLAEGVEYESQESFVAKVATLKESYFKATGTDTQEEVQESSEQKTSSPAMQAYLNALSKTI
jgi:hypothetical protein